MMGYIVVNLSDISEMKELDAVISDFSCPFNKDIEDFIKNKAQMFSKQRIASVYLVFTSYKDKSVLVGYFALAIKHFHIDSKNPGNIGKNLLKRIAKFGVYDKELRKYIISAPLIGQLGKNYANGYNNLITGDELLKLACDRVKEILRIGGGKIVYLECEDNPFLLRFYEDNGFWNFGKRILDADEKDKVSGKCLIQLLRYLE